MCPVRAKYSPSTPSTPLSHRIEIQAVSKKRAVNGQMNGTNVVQRTPAYIAYSAYTPYGKKRADDTASSTARYFLADHAYVSGHTPCECIPDNTS